MNRAEAAHVIDAKRSRPVGVEHVLAAEHTRTILVLSFDEIDVGGARIWRGRRGREPVQHIEAWNEEVEGELERQRNDQSAECPRLPWRRKPDGDPADQRAADDDNRAACERGEKKGAGISGA